MADQSVDESVHAGGRAWNTLAASDTPETISGQ
jgi:hypothetical protein